MAPPQPKRPRRARARTPENAAELEVEASAVKMSELCRDPKTGKTSRREAELRKLDRRKKQAKKAGRSDGGDGDDGSGGDDGENGSRSRETGKTEDTQTAAAASEQQRNDRKRPHPDSTATSVPGMRIVNGEIILDADTLQVDRQAQAEAEAGPLEEVTESSLTRRITSASFGKRTKAEVWDEHFTELFYRGLRMFGTDFMMISKMFPGRNRRQIKLKFCTEERRNPARVRDVLLGPRETVTLEEMSQMTDTVYDDPAVVQAELDEERRRMEADHEREKQAKEESMRMSGADQPMPSIEGANGGGIRARFRPRGKGAFGGGSAKMGGGSEEILGTID